MWTRLLCAALVAATMLSGLGLAAHAEDTYTESSVWGAVARTPQYPLARVFALIAATSADKCAEPVTVLLIYGQEVCELLQAKGCVGKEAIRFRCEKGPEGPDLTLQTNFTIDRNNNVITGDQ